MNKYSNNKITELSIRVIIALIVVLFLVFISFIIIPKINDIISDANNKQEALYLFKEYLLGYGNFGVAVFIGLQILQVVIAVIPGELMQFAGGYVYGTLYGAIYSISGIMIGSTLAFYISRMAGYPIVKLIVSREKLDQFSKIINGPKGELTLFLLFLIPGIPKDITTYAAGLTPIKFSKFFIIALIGRIPALIGSSLIGSSIGDGNYFVAIILVIVAVSFFVLGLLFRKKLLQ